MPNLRLCTGRGDGRDSIYFTATPQGVGSVVTEPCGVSAPLEGVIAYSETVSPFELATNIQLSSLRMAIEVG